MRHKAWLVVTLTSILIIVGAFIIEVVTPPPQQTAETSFFKNSNENSDTSSQYTAPSTSGYPSVIAQDSFRHAISPIPKTPNINKKLAKIGWLLFRDPNLSSNRNISCESCHSLNTNGAEYTNVSTGVGGKGSRNSLTVFNTAYNYRFFWDGRANSLFDQLDGPVHDIREMDSNWAFIANYVTRSQLYSKLFEQANLDINEQNIKATLVEFMKGLTTPSSPFDQYLLGNKSALNEQQIRGWESFQKEGCVNCHRGVNIGGGMVMRFGYFGEDKIGKQRSSDTGKHRTTNRQKDMYLFRVASLRNVANTPPYFHDGRTESLREAIQIMAESQLGKTFDKSTTEDLYAFLTTLTGQRPAILEEFSNDANH
ncbi:c-type cytochrome [Vibrio sp. S4M6]|uniref:cytochrome-c peroxidase n=1 Tax=Vibrio sinus TaxID=2946865 RepID=UPI002029D5F1|nr:cytochrome c peroxidase [Vibrio sinus]MCL9779972.1 c-type cytochrome [Vibrio sinus]